MKGSRALSLPLLALWLVNGAFGQVADPAQPVEAPISYSTLEEAIEALRAKPGVTFREQDGWIVAEDPEGPVAWLLTPPGHPAYPSIVKRAIVNRDDGAYFETHIRCLASKDVCDSFFGGN
jgi:hypothetical protein